MRLIYDPNLSERLDVTVDPAAEPVDLDEALSEFLIQFTRTTRKDRNANSPHDTRAETRSRKG